MNRVRQCLIAVALLACLPALAPAFPGRCVGVPSGDRIEVERGDGVVVVALAGIVAPLPEQAYGEAARRYLTAAILDREVSIDVKRLAPGRVVVGEVFEMGHWLKSLNTDLVRRGLAWRDPDSHDIEGLKLREELARQERWGLWGDPDPVPPWEFVPQPVVFERREEGPVVPLKGTAFDRLAVPRESEEGGAPELLANALNARALYDAQERLQRFREFVLPYYYYGYLYDPLNWTNPWWYDNYMWQGFDTGYSYPGPGFGVHREFIPSYQPPWPYPPYFQYQ